MKIKILATMASILFLATNLPAFADEKTFEREAVYLAGTGDTEATAKVMAFNNVSKLLYGDLVAFVKKEGSKPAAKPKTKKKKGKKTAKYVEEAPIYIVTQESNFIAPGIAPVETVDAKWDGKQYAVKAKITVEQEKVIRHFRNLNSDREELKTLKDFAEKTSARENLVEEARKELEAANGSESAVSAFNLSVAKLEALESFIKGYAFGTVNRNERAVECFDRAIELDKNMTAAYTGRGFAWENLGKLDKAVADYTRAVELDPNDPANFNNRGNVLDTMGDHYKAIEDYDKAIGMDPNNAKAFGNRGTTYLELGDLQHALADLNQSIKLDPLVPMVYVNRGILYTKMGDNVKAIADLVRAARMGFTDAQAILEQQNVDWRNYAPAE